MIKEEIIDKIIKNKDKYFCLASRPLSTQRTDTVAQSFIDCLGTTVVNFLEKGNDVVFYIERSKFKKFSLDLGKKFQSNKFISKHLKEYSQGARQLLSASEGAKQVKANKKDLLVVYQKYNQVLKQFALFFLTPFSIDDYIFPSLKAQIDKLFVPAEAQKILDIISSPTVVFGYQQYQIDVLSMGNKINHKRLLDKYRWIREYSYQEELLTKEMIDQDIKKFKQSGLDKDIFVIEDKCQKNKKQLASLLRKLTDQNLKIKIKLVNSYINIKTERIETYKMAQTNMRTWFEKFALVLKQDYPTIKYKQTIFLTDQEIIDYLRLGTKFDLKLINKRVNKEFVSFRNKKELCFIYDSEMINKVRDSFLSLKRTESIKGLTVSLGKARGKVRVVVVDSDLAKIKTGEILVANFTSPQYVPAMKRAAAIVTNDGGITCHAAIVSRELKKPCIVGAKVATRLLKTGDRIEVDADQGLVKIIK